MFHSCSHRYRQSLIFPIRSDSKVPKKPLQVALHYINIFRVCFETPKWSAEQAICFYVTPVRERILNSKYQVFMLKNAPNTQSRTRTQIYV